MAENIELSQIMLAYNQEKILYILLYQAMMNHVYLQEMLILYI